MGAQFQGEDGHRWCFKTLASRRLERQHQRQRTVTLGANEKGGMDEAEFFKYLETNVLPLYPNAAPEKWKWVILKCDSGPGRENIELLAELRDSGLILFPGVPIATAVHQETDQSYGPFKTAYAQSLQEVIDEHERVHQKKPSCIPPWMVGMVVFGGCDSETGLVVERNAFEDGFSRKMQIKWIMQATKEGRQEAHCLWKRIVRDTEVHMDCDKRNMVTVRKSTSGLWRRKSDGSVLWPLRRGRFIYGTTQRKEAS